MSRDWIGFKIEDNEGLYRKVDEMHAVILDELDAPRKKYDALLAAAKEALEHSESSVVDSILRKAIEEAEKP